MGRSFGVAVPSNTWVLQSPSVSWCHKEVLAQGWVKAETWGYNPARPLAAYSLRQVPEAWLIGPQRHCSWVP